MMGVYCLQEERPILASWILLPLLLLLLLPVQWSLMMYNNLPTVSFPHSDMTMMVNPAVLTTATKPRGASRRGRMEARAVEFKTYPV